MKRLIILVRRAIAVFRVRSLEIQLDGHVTALDQVRDPSTQIDIINSKRATQHELLAARRTYLGLFPPGVRKTWDRA